MSIEHLHPVEANNDTPEKLLEKQLNNALSLREQAFLKSFHVAKERLDQLYTFSASREEQRLKDELASIAQMQENISPEEVQTSFQELIILKNTIRTDIAALRQEVNTDYINATFQSQEMICSRFMSPNIIKRCEEPVSVGDHLIGTGVGLLETTLWTGKLAGDVVWGFVKLPYDTYQLISKK